MEIVHDRCHVAASPGAEWQDFPGVRDTLERWQLIPKDSPKSAVGQLGIGVERVIASSKDPVKAFLGFLKSHPADLIVLAVHQHEGRMRWLEKSVGEPIARGAGQITLFIPHGAEGFVSQQDGSISLRNILIPVTSKPRPQPSVEAAAHLIVMTTDGPDGFLDGLRGATSERVLRKAPCPVANLPVGSMLG